LIVGSGLTGATIARLLHDAGREVLVLERRDHVGGNVHDHLHPSGIRIHTYGPHSFRTGSERIWNFVRRFSPFIPFRMTVKSFVDGAYENWPVVESYVRRVVAPDWQPEFKGTPQNFEQASLSMMPRLIYEKFVKGYTEKQWGVPACSLSPALARRIDFRADDNPYFKLHKYQGLPRDGYAALMENMLEGIPVRKRKDYLARRDEFRANKHLIFTGPIDEFFEFDLGKLTYRGQRREHKYLPDVESVLPGFQVNYPDPASGPHIRTLEWKHLPSPNHERVTGTVLTTETPYSPSDPNAYEYPFPNAENAALYARYRRRANTLKNVLICGRLGEYRYYDMDQAIARALMLGQRLLQRE
jgi:UDP-galactopyranose mutase